MDRLDKFAELESVREAAGIVDRLAVCGVGAIAILNLEVAVAMVHRESFPDFPDIGRLDKPWGPAAEAHQNFHREF